MALRLAALAARARGTSRAGLFFKAITLGYGVMPSFAGELTTEERWAVVAYVRALQEPERAGTTLPADGSAASGRGRPRSRSVATTVDARTG